MRRIAGIALILLAACGNSTPSPPATSSPVATTAITTAATTAATTGPTTAATTAPTTPATTAPTTAATSGATGIAAACSALDRLDAAFTAFVPDYDETLAAATQVLDVSNTLSDPTAATLLAVIGSDGQNAAQAFKDGDLDKGAKFQNRAAGAIPTAKRGLGCT